MKNLLIFVNPKKKFEGDYDSLAKIQIDNSLDLGWKKKDILLVTNFKYKYKGIKSLLIDEEGFHSPHVQATKITALLSLFKNGTIENDIYWLHDFDAYQLEPISEQELDLGNKDAAFTTYGWSIWWCLGSLFFTKNAGDIFSWISETMAQHKVDDERALRSLTRKNYKNIRARIKRLNITYNFGMRHIGINYSQYDKPIKVVHFHPWYMDNINTLDTFMYGENVLGFPLMNERLIKIFHIHGIE